MSVTHIAGRWVLIDGRFMRQRCAWCPAVLVDLDLSRVAVAGEDASVPKWEEGALITVDGVQSYAREPYARLTTIIYDACYNAADVDSGA